MNSSLIRKAAVIISMGISLSIITLLILGDYPLKETLLMGLTAVGCFFVAGSQITLLKQERNGDNTA